jgi:hypothetical protein
LGSQQAVPDEPEPVPDGSVVLRGGDLGGSSREKNLRDVHEAYGIWGICATSQERLTAEELAPLVRCGNRMLMPGEVDELRKAGFDVVKEPGKEWPDALITFSEEPGPEDWERLQSVMVKRGRIPNPKYRGK